MEEWWCQRSSMPSIRKIMLQKQRRDFILLGTIQMELNAKLLDLLPNVFVTIPTKIMTSYKVLKRKLNASSLAVNVWISTISPFTDLKILSVLVSTLIKITIQLKNHVQTVSVKHLLQVGDALVDRNSEIIRRSVSIAKRKSRKARQLDTNKVE